MVFRLDRWPKSFTGVVLLVVINYDVSLENVDHIVSLVPEVLST